MKSSNSKQKLDNINAEKVNRTKKILNYLIMSSLTVHSIDDIDSMIWSHGSFIHSRNENINHQCLCFICSMCKLFIQHKCEFFSSPKFASVSWKNKRSINIDFLKETLTNTEWKLISKCSIQIIIDCKLNSLSSASRHLIQPKENKKNWSFHQQNSGNSKCQAEHFLCILPIIKYLFYVCV